MVQIEKALHCKKWVLNGLSEGSTVCRISAYPKSRESGFYRSLVTRDKKGIDFNNTVTKSSSYQPTSSQNRLQNPIFTVRKFDVLFDDAPAA